MKAFTYRARDDARRRPRAAAAQPGARIIAGGTNLLDLMKLQVETPVAARRHQPPAARQDRSDARRAACGSARWCATAISPPTSACGSITGCLSRALLAGASAQLRNKATTGGNLLQRTRCYYFYDITKPCNKRSPDRAARRIGGFNRIHAILGASDPASPRIPRTWRWRCARSMPRSRRVKADGARRAIPIAGFHRLPGDTPQIETVLEPGRSSPPCGCRRRRRASQIYRKVRDRASYAFALVSVAAVIQTTGGRIRSARLAFGGLAPKAVARAGGRATPGSGRAPNAGQSSKRPRTPSWRAPRLSAATISRSR